jgi:hypothetical protein
MIYTQQKVFNEAGNILGKYKRLNGAQCLWAPLKEDHSTEIHEKCTGQSLEMEK